MVDDGDVQRGNDTAEQPCVLFAFQNCETVFIHVLLVW